jgi:hypothetical protein
VVVGAGRWQLLAPCLWVLARLRQLLRWCGSLTSFFRRAALVVLLSHSGSDLPLDTL